MIKHRKRMPVDSVKTALADFKPSVMRVGLADLELESATGHVGVEALVGRDLGHPSRSPSVTRS